jgi:Alpha/beta hydrolase
MSAIGSRPEDLIRLSELVNRVASDLDHSRHRITYGLDNTIWLGPDADWFRNRWHGSGTAHLRANARMLHELGSELRREADEQERTSAASTVAVTQVHRETSESTLLATASCALNEFDPGTITPAEFAVNLLDQTIEKPGSIPSGHFRVIVLDGEPKRMIVIMPGVENLTKGFNAGKAAATPQIQDAITPAGLLGASVFGRAAGAIAKEWLTKDPNNDRTMGSAGPAATLGYGRDDYAKTVHNQLEQFMVANNIPRGTEVAIVGHSYGSIASGNLVENTDFNGGLVNVTHWVPTAAGQQNVRQYLPSHTASFAVDNTDPVVVAGSLGNAIEHAPATVLRTIHDQFLPPQTHTQTHAESISAHILGYGGLKGFGHAQENYETIIRNNADTAAPFLNDMSASYQGAGTIYDLPATSSGAAK